MWPASSSAAPPKQRLMDVPASSEYDPRWQPELPAQSPRSGSHRCRLTHDLPRPRVADAESPTVASPTQAGERGTPPQAIVSPSGAACLSSRLRGPPTTSGTPGGLSGIATGITLQSQVVSGRSDPECSSSCLPHASLRAYGGGKPRVAPPARARRVGGIHSC